MQEENSNWAYLNQIHSYILDNQINRTVVKFILDSIFII